MTTKQTTGLEKLIPETERKRRRKRINKTLTKRNLEKLINVITLAILITLKKLFKW